MLGLRNISRFLKVVHKLLYAVLCGIPVPSLTDVLIISTSNQAQLSQYMFCVVVPWAFFSLLMFMMYLLTLMQNNLQQQYYIFFTHLVEMLCVFWGRDAYLGLQILHVMHRDRVAEDL